MGRTFERPGTRGNTAQIIILKGHNISRSGAQTFDRRPGGNGTAAEARARLALTRRSPGDLDKAKCPGASPGEASTDI